MYISVYMKAETKLKSLFIFIYYNIKSNFLRYFQSDSTICRIVQEVFNALTKKPLSKLIWPLIFYHFLTVSFHNAFWYFEIFHFAKHMKIKKRKVWCKWRLFSNVSISVFAVWGLWWHEQNEGLLWKMHSCFKMAYHLFHNCVVNFYHLQS